MPGGNIRQKVQGGHFKSCRQADQMSLFIAQMVEVELVRSRMRYPITCRVVLNVYSIYIVDAHSDGHLIAQYRGS